MTKKIIEIPNIDAQLEDGSEEILKVFIHPESLQLTTIVNSEVNPDPEAWAVVIANILDIITQEKPLKEAVKMKLAILKLISDTTVTEETWSKNFTTNTDIQ